ncbi:dimethylglycine dehydrogenase [Kiloniella spongiae]|uniref:Dimethylglycine dehydrogenase n=1 Tax=Kiloniella spongiae TaxID=1489064 RepID=A0A0H2MCL7_9PROT|nr:FAD-dependent oxidoreductase [Kiloniella spongiae]KLN60088.1 dimethylglycine dehydrogenase [Kiloniella spongiae]
MKSHYKAVVIGGGAVGVGTLYHLAKKGWSDVALLERHDLTSGSTWHAAGLLPLFNMSYSVGKIHQYSVDLYSRLEEETGLNSGLKQVSNIRLARTQDRMDEYRYYVGVAKTLGIDVKWLSIEELKEIWPLCNTDGVLGAIQHVEDGYVQPAELTQALAKGARNNGAEIHQHTTVLGMEQQDDDSWIVQTDKGDISCEHVISCTGNFARQTGEMVGLDIPVIPVEHQFIVTEPHPDIKARHAAGLPEMGVLRESDSSWYMREEAGGLLLGPYEVGAPCCYVDGPAPDAKYELFNGELERLMPYIETAFERVPAFAEVGIKEVYNGAIAYTPDGSPIIGPAWGLKNFWLNEGHSFGITATGGAGWQLAEWIVDGEPTIDMSGVDPRRFGPYAGRGFLKEKNEEAYANVFTVHYPDESRPAARGLKRSPSYDRMKEHGAVMGTIFGWERPNWFAPEGYGLTEEDLNQDDTLTRENHAPAEEGKLPVEKWSFRRSNYFEHVGNECKNVMENVGLLDMSAFSKFIVKGRGAEAWLSSLVANKIPKKIGRMALTHMLTLHGGVRAEFTILKTGKQSYYLVSAGAQERHDWDYLTKLKPTDGSVELEKITTQQGVFIIAGPKSRLLMEKLSDADFSNKAFPWLTAQQISVGIAPVTAARVNFVGEYGWELHHPIEMQNYLFDVLMEAGAEFGLKPFGIRAMDSMRLEKSYRLIPTEMSIEYSALETGLDRFVRLDKEDDFIGKQALADWKERGFDNQFVTLEVHGVTDCDARGSEPIYLNDEMVGRVTSGGYGFRTQKSIALAMVRPDLAEIGTELNVYILGNLFKATVVEESPYDPENKILRNVE